MLLATQATQCRQAVRRHSSGESLVNAADSMLFEAVTALRDINGKLAPSLPKGEPRLLNGVILEFFRDNPGTGVSKKDLLRHQGDRGNSGPNGQNLTDFHVNEPSNET